MLMTTSLQLSQTLVPTPQQQLVAIQGVFHVLEARLHPLV